MTTRHLRQPTLDCAEPRELAEFYRQLLGWVYADGHEDARRLGARPLTGTPEDGGHTDDPFRVYADPSGHPFCLCLAAQ
ncbi:VOC family protein [Cellulomonas sp. P5_C5]